MIEQVMRIMIVKNIVKLRLNARIGRARLKEKIVYSPPS
jgi:hypothetical protein